MSTEQHETDEEVTDEPMLVIKPVRHNDLCIAIPSRLFEELQGNIFVLSDATGTAQKVSEYDHVSDSPEIRTLPKGAMTAIKVATRIRGKEREQQRINQEIMYEQAQLQRSKYTSGNTGTIRTTFSDRTYPLGK